MSLNPDRLYLLPDQEAFPYYQALWYAGLADATSHLQGAYIARRLGRLHSARNAILQARSTKPEGSVRGEVEFFYAILLRELGEPERTVELLTRWLREYESEYPSLTDEYLGPVYYNRALALRQLGRYVESVADYQQACSEHKRIGRLEKLQKTLHNLAWVACLLGQEQVAGEALAEADSLPITPSADVAWHQKIGHAFYAAISSDADLERAMSLCREIVDCADPDIPPAVRAQAYWIAGRVALAFGHISDAERMAERALLWGAAAGPEVRCLIDASALWQEVRDKKSNPEKG